jgi:orotidine-5'-phosphate decarboxylase
METGELAASPGRIDPASTEVCRSPHRPLHARQAAHRTGHGVTGGHPGPRDRGARRAGVHPNRRALSPGVGKEGHTEEEQKGQESHHGSNGPMDVDLTSRNGQSPHLFSFETVGSFIS